MLCWRRISAIGTPASPCFMISTIWLSVNRDFRMGTSLAPESLPSKCLLRGEAYAAALSAVELLEAGLPGPGPARHAVSNSQDPDGPRDRVLLRLRVADRAG